MSCDLLGAYLGCTCLIFPFVPLKYRELTDLTLKKNQALIIPEAVIAKHSEAHNRIISGSAELVN